MHAAQRADRLDRGGSVGSAEIGVALPQGAPQVGGGEAQRVPDCLPIAGGILELVGSDADVIRLLRHGDGSATTIAERAAARGEDDALGARCRGQRRPAAPLHDLDLRRPSQQHQESEEHEAEDRLEPRERARHG